MNPTERTDAEIIDLTGDLSDANDSPDESHGDRRDNASRSESPWRSLHLTGRPWYREDTERRERELEQIERKHRREAAELLQYYQSQRFHDKIGRLALRPRSPAESVGCANQTDSELYAKRPPKVASDPFPNQHAAAPATEVFPAPEPDKPPVKSSHARPPPEMVSAPSREVLVPEPAKPETESLAATPAAEPAKPADKSSPSKPSPEMACGPSRQLLVPEPANSATRIPFASSAAEPSPAAESSPAKPSCEQLVLEPTPMLTSEPTPETLPAAPTPQPSSTKFNEAPLNSTHSNPSAQPGQPDAKRVCVSLPGKKNARRPRDLRKLRLFATDDYGTSATTSVEEKPTQRPPTQPPFAFSTLGQRAVAEMLASATLRTGTVRDGIQFLAERREAREKRGPNKVTSAFAQSKNHQARSKKPCRAKKVSAKKTTGAQQTDPRPADKKRESTSPRRPTPSPSPASRRFHHAAWPAKVANIRQQYNPLEICFEYETPFAGFCGCDSPCRHDTCRNGVLGIFCAPNCCLYDGKCGNGLAEIDNVKLVRRDQSSELAVVATAPIEKGMMIGQYLGKFITLEVDDNHSSSDDFENFAVPTLNTGYRYEFKRDSTSHPGVKIFVDAEKYGCITRFLNHSCNAAARFREVRNGSKHTVVVVAVRDIKSGEEITVDYGTDIWFVCQCKELNCRHRYLRLVSQQ